MGVDWPTDKSDSAVAVEKEFVKKLREVCEETGTLLIADEVITGFRLARGGAQEAFGVIPDLTTFGKAIGGGEFPVGAVGGRAKIMELMDNRKHSDRSELVMRGGTYVGNPLVMRAGYEATKVYEKGKFYNHIDRLGEKLRKGLEEVVHDMNVNAYVSGYGSMVKLHLLKKQVDKHDLKTLVTNGDGYREQEYFRHLLSKGIFAMTPGQVHFYVSLPHMKDEIERTIKATKDFLKSTK